ncbi:MAG: DUF6262 family protein [Pseudonocardiaceae bacterium]
MADNSDALRRARRRDSVSKRSRAAEGLQAMIESGAAISFPAVARRAGVSVSLLYNDAELAGRISDARDRQRQAGADRAWRLPARSLVTEQSLRADLANTREQARQLSEEVALLRNRLARDLGAEADVARGRLASPLVDQLENRAAELEADNHNMRQRITGLEGEVTELTATVEVARALNRELMSEINRNDARIPDPPRPATGRRR